MSIEIIQGKNVPIHLWAPANELESMALDQIRNIAALPWVFHHVALMADGHVGKGATVGSVIPMKGALSPSCIGVDIGCGVQAVETSITADQLPSSLAKLRDRIEQLIPVGFSGHQTPVALNDYEVSQINKRTGLDDYKVESFDKLFQEFHLLHPKVQDLMGRAMTQIGSAGGGNHWIEMCLDSGKCPCQGHHDCAACGGKGKRSPHVWLTLHSGSRNIGKSVADAHVAEAKLLEHNQQLPDRDLAVFLSGTPQMESYRHDLYWCQRYALLNRATLMALFQKSILEFFRGAEFEAPIQCHHNYAEEQVFFGEKLLITRKGAINAAKGRLGIIPGSMGTATYIVRGLGNEESFGSASHGAGRKMSRGQAKKRFTVKDLEEQTKGICCRKDSGVLDEIPGAYKDIRKVMEYQKDLVEIVAELHQVLCVKG